MLYTIENVREKLDNLNSRFVKVEIDGEIKGIALMSDLRERVFAHGENGRRRIRKVFLSGTMYDVSIGINLYPATEQDLWTPRGHIKDERDRCLGQPVVSHQGKEDAMNTCEPLVSWDVNTGIIKIRNDTDNRRHKSTKKGERVGIIERIRRWLKGDKHYKR